MLRSYGMRKLSLLVVFVSCLSVPAFADNLIQVQGFNFSGQSTLLEIKPFDPSLGTLDSVNVTITGAITGVIITLPNFVPDPFGNLFPLPQPYSVTITQNFTGGPFTFFLPAQATLSGTSTGTGDNIPITLPFNYGFTFDQFSNLTGFATGSGSISGGTSPGLIDGTLNGWESSIPLLLFENTLVLEQQSFGVSPSVPPIEQGGLIVQYSYETPPVSTPEPGSLPLLASALAGLCLVARRKRSV